MILVPGTKLEAVLAGAVAANQPEAHVDYVSYGQEGVASYPLSKRTALNGATDATILAAPTAGQSKTSEPIRACIYNKDTAAVTVTVKTDDGTTEMIECKVTLQTTESLCFEKDTGWYVLQANGARKQGSGVTGPASSTDNAAVRWDGATGTLIQNSAFVIDDDGDVSSFGGQIKFPASQSSSADANTLDDYEEGTWTPVLTFATAGDLDVVYSSQVGSYTKIGNLVRATFGTVTSTFTHSTASGNCNITGLPFASANVTGNVHLGSMRWQGITKANYTDVSPQLGVASSALDFQASGSGQSTSPVATGDMPSGGTVNFRGTIFYQTA